MYISKTNLYVLALRVIILENRMQISTFEAMILHDDDDDLGHQ